MAADLTGPVVSDVLRIVSRTRTRVSDALRAAGDATWTAAVRHPMVRAIGDGTLPHETFRGYFEQNVLYLRDYVRAIAIVVSKAPDTGSMRTLTRFLTRICDEEIPANLRFLERLGGDVDRAAHAGVPEMHPTTYAYTRHLLATCALGDRAEGLTAVLPCQWSYGELARPLMASRPADPIYADWISMFGDDDYDALVEASTDLLDLLVGSDEARLAALRPIFERSVRYEVEFWDMAYASGSSRRET
jgi:thiaminase/transcriptional activator TenA